LECIEAMGIRIVPGSLRKMASSLKRLPPAQLKEIKALCIRRLERLREMRVKSRSDLLRRLKKGIDIEAIAKTLTMTPRPAVYLMRSYTLLRREPFLQGEKNLKYKDSRFSF